MQGSLKRKVGRWSTHGARLIVFCAALVVVVIAAMDMGLPSQVTAQVPAGESFTNFETEPVRPLALSPEGDVLYALNTADDRLQTFFVEPTGLRPAGEVFVGLRPVAVAVRGHGEVFVVNHLGDSLVRIDASDPSAPRVMQTVYVGDEPRDIVIAGPDGDRIFVTAAYRGELTTPGIGRASVMVFDADDIGRAPQEVRLFGTKPRALAVSPDGRQVFAGIFHSGNGTTSVAEEAVVEHGGQPPPPTEYVPRAEATAPASALIVRRDNAGVFRDETGRDWRQAIEFNLPDKDVFVLDATADVPREIRSIAGVGTIIFNMAVHPATGELWVTNTEARNEVRYEPRVRSHTYVSRVTMVDTNTGRVLQATHLNPHLDTIRDSFPQPDSIKEDSLAQPLSIVFSSDGKHAFVAAFQSSKVGVLDADARVVERIDVGFGPGGLALDEANGRLYVLNHLDASITVVDIAARDVVDTVPLAYAPAPRVITEGRPFFYDATLTSGHGDMACSSCHVFGDLDGLAWDLSGPFGDVEDMPWGLSHDNFVLKPRDFKFHPVKGVMVTQSLRGMAGAGPMHWRGDRHGPPEDPANELLSFRTFNPAFVDLNGLSQPLDTEDMDRFGRFILTLRYPPNPVQQLDRSLNEEEAQGLQLFGGESLVDSGITNCEGCHPFPTGTNRQINFEGARTGQDFKSPHLRNMYQKVGRFNATGDQVAGFGFLHDGATDTIFSFINSGVFEFPGENAVDQRSGMEEVETFVLAFDTGMAPAVGRQVTLADGQSTADDALLDILIQRADAGDCALVAHVRDATAERGWLRWDGAFYSDRVAEQPVDMAILVAMPYPVTFTCVPPDDGARVALDRDGDGWLNGDERDSGTNPADPSDQPAGAAPAPPWRDKTANPATPPATETAIVATSTATPSVMPTRSSCLECRDVYLPIGLADVPISAR